MDTLLERGATVGAYVATIGVFVVGVGGGAYVASKSGAYIVRGLVRLPALASELWSATPPA